ncbi:hypothetical protein BH09MYX1_BH09MYX1_35150 [soil metagenome]
MNLHDARAVIAVMARRPGSTSVKTRLSARLDEGTRAKLYEAFLTDKLAQLGRIDRCRGVVAVAPPDEPAAIAPWLPAGFGSIPQRGSDLGERLDAVAGDLFSDGARAVLLVDSDTPTLPDALIEEAVLALESGTVDVVIGPAADGGYYLVGMRAPAPSLFRDIAWSTSAVLGETLAAADGAGLRVHLLQSWYDVDTPDDLDRLCRELATLSPFAPWRPRATARFLTDRVEKLRPRDEHWTTRSVRGVYANRFIEVSESVATLPSGHVSLYGIVSAPPCVGILPFVTPNEVLLVRQFRYVARRFTWEMPTGGVHEGESHAEAARRELREEAGVEATSLTPLVSIATNKSILDETAHLFIAEVGARVAAQADATEEIDCRTFSLAEALAMVHRGEIVDSMTIVALFASAAKPSRST